MGEYNLEVVYLASPPNVRNIMKSLQFMKKNDNFIENLTKKLNN
jgi:hypothetical protein